MYPPISEKIQPNKKINKSNFICKVIEMYKKSIQNTDIKIINKVLRNIFKNLFVVILWIKLKYSNKDRTPKTIIEKTNIKSLIIIIKVIINNIKEVIILFLNSEIVILLHNFF